MAAAGTLLDRAHRGHALTKRIVARPSARTYARRRLVALLVAASVVALGVLALSKLVFDGNSAQPAHSAGAKLSAGPVSGTHVHRRRARFQSLAGIPIGRWTTQPDAPLSRGEVSAAVVGTAVYVVGGFDTSGHTTGAVERLDPGSGRWNRSPSLPEPLNHMSAVGYRGDLYVVGGYSQAGDTSAGAVRSFWRFDPGSRRWSAMAAAPLARAAAGAAVLGNRLYVAGGRSDTQTTISSLAIFDFDTGKWSLGPPLHRAREHVAAAAAAGAVWVLGGRALGQGNFADVERYRPGAPGWQQMAPMPVARSGFQAVTVDGKIITVGGEDATATIGEVDRLDPAAGHWDRLPDLPTPRHGLGLVALGSLVLAIEGGPHPGLTTSRTVQRLRVP
jgi:Kelch motif